MTSRSSFCNSCHEMKSQSINWQESGHSKQRCVDCHRLTSLQKAGMLFTHVSGVSPGLTTTTPVACLNCHTEDRVITPSGDLRIPHTTHLDRKVDCGSCHPAAGHVKDGSGTNEGTVVMAVCIKCHYQNGATVGCRACHRKLPATVAHLKADWPVNHGKYAAQGLKGCNECHKYTLYLKSQSVTTVDL
ncbi:MAG TPA: NapC/NirT family cytochrome c, partial [Verrucomicrobiae bacterium]|nr:NapC/NirT family cytochrome c [Verrucomicrobiae bacterium]